MTTTAIPIEAPLGTDTQRGDPFLFKRLPTWWMLLALFLMADGGGIFTTQGIHPDAVTAIGGGGGVDQSKVSIQILSDGMWVICAGLAFGHLGPALKLMMKQKAALAFFVLALLSTFWSQSPGLTFRKSLMLFIYLLFAWFFVTYYKPMDQMRLFLALGVVMGVGSVLWGLLLPKYGLHASGEWKGIFGQKNMLGSGMFFLFSGLPFVPIDSIRRLSTILLQALLPLSLILLSRSRSSLIMSMILVGVRVLGPLMTRMRREALPFLVFCIGLGIAMIPITAEIILPLLGRDLTLTGRTHIWGMLFPLALKRLWLGYGYQAFFVKASGEPGPIMFGTGTGALFSVDNGYLDILLQCGLAGIGLVFALFLSAMRDLLALLRRPYVPLVAFWYAGLVITIFTGSVVENMLWKPIRVIPFILAFACAGLANLRYQIHSASQATIGIRAGP